VDPSRLLAPRSVAVVGASTRPGSYGNQAVANLVAAGFAGPLFGVHPTAREVHGVPCVPRLSDLPSAPDAVVVATPAATVPDLVAEAGEIGCGGAVVFAAGFAEISAGAALQDKLRAAALAHDLPVCGPNGNGIVSVHRRAPMWGDSCALRRAGPVALVSQSGNVAVNALGSARGLRLHTVVSCGNQAVLEASDYLAAIAELDGVRSIALYLEADGDGAALAGALAACAERDVGVVVLKAGSSRLGASAAAAHTGAVAGDARVFRALVEEAGGVWAHNPHELLEVAKALGYGRRRSGRATSERGTSEAEPPNLTGRGAAIVTCSGGDAATGADEAARLGVDLPPFTPATAAALAAVLPATATAANPLDYTAIIFGETGPTADLVALSGRDEAIGAVLVYYDRPGDLGADAAQSWDGALAGIVAGAARLDTPVLVASTLPDLMPEPVAETLADAGIVPVCGLTEGVACARALLRAPGDPVRLRAIAAAAASPAAASPAAAASPDAAREWLAEHEAKDLLRSLGVPVPDGEVVTDADAAVAAARRLGGPVAVKLSSPDVRHKSDIGAVHIGVDGDDAVRRAVAALRAIPGHGATPVLVEAMVAPGLEVMVAVKRDGVVPVLVLALGGTWVEVLDDAAVIPLPVDPATVRARVAGLRAAALFTGGRGRPAVDLDGLGRLAAAVADAALTHELELIELNPVIVGPAGVSVVDALISRVRPPAVAGYGDPVSVERR
jgi:acetate---CoA ligase (ADP-forming)